MATVQHLEARLLATASGDAQPPDDGPVFGPDGIADLVRVNVVGESHYQSELAAIAGPKTDDGYVIAGTVELVPEPTNAYDANAVTVRIDGTTVGYLARAVAQAFGLLMVEAGLPGQSLDGVAAEIRGGWQRGADEGHYGVLLYLPSAIAQRLGV